MQKIWIRLMGITLILAFLAGCNVAPAPTTLASGGTIFDPPRAVNDAEFIDQSGKPKRFSDLKTKMTLLFFGYTNCPDVCSITVSDFSRVRVALAARANQANFVFISVDPARDIPQVLTRYLSSFDPSFIGLTTDKDTLQKFAKGFDVIFDNGDDAGVIGHSTRSYLLDAQGRLRASYEVGVLPDQIAADMENMLNNGS